MRSDEIIIRSLNIKKSVVEQDEKEAGLRRILNFGHTVGHGIESSKSELYHGECVALVGESGCGKSTLAKLLLGFLTPAEGRLYLRGKDAGNIPLRQLRTLRTYRTKCIC